MFNVGPMEMLVIFVVALVVVGPEKLPAVGRAIGKGLAEFRRASAELRGSLEREMQNIEYEAKQKESSSETVNPPVVASSVHNTELPYDQHGESHEQHEFHP